MLYQLSYTPSGGKFFCLIVLACAMVFYAGPVRSSAKNSINFIKIEPTSPIASKDKFDTPKVSEILEGIKWD